MKTKTIKLYEYSELSPKAQKIALNNWNQDNDYPFMQSHMINVLKEKLEERGIKYDTDSIDVRYSLSHCQGDGFMFIGKVMWREKEITIKHSSSRYYHLYTASFDYDGLTDDEFGQFEAVYKAICKEMERFGYDHIENEQSEENFVELCNANEYTFRENGEMENL